MANQPANRHYEGRAYAFFDCRATKAAIVEEIATARHYNECPSELELDLIEGEEALSKDPDATRALEAAKKYLLNRLPKVERARTNVGEISYGYALRAKLPNKTNYAAASQLRGVMNCLSGKRLYPQGGESYAEIVYQRGDKLVHAHRSDLNFIPPEEE